MIEQIKSDHEKGQWLTKEDAAALWDLFSDPRFHAGKEKFCRRIARLPELEEDYIAAVEALEKIASASVVGFGPQAAGEALAQVKLVARAAISAAKGATA